MIIKIFAKNLKITEGIESSINEKLEFLNKFLKEDTCVNVKIKIEKESHIIKIVTVYQTQIIEVKESTDDLYKSIDIVSDTLKAKLSKLHKHSIDKKRKKEILDIDDTYEHKKRNKITKRKSFQMKPMSEEEAILQMELLKYSSFMFINADLDFTMCLLYKKKDGNYGIIEGLLDEEY